jgi:acetyl esterase/lipase
MLIAAIIIAALHVLANADHAEGGPARWLPTPPIRRPPIPMRSHTEVADLAYVPDSADPKQRLDLFVPKLETGVRAPMAVFVHGGVWALGDRKEFTHVGKALAQRGIVTAVMSYRLAPAAKHPAQIEDVAQALTWLVAQGTGHGGDPKRIFLIGHSAGAHLVTLLALDGRWLGTRPEARQAIAGVIALSGIYDLEQPFGDPGQDTGKDYVARAFGAQDSSWREASPVRYLTPQRDLPIFLVMAERDYAGIRTQTAMMERAMREAGWPPRARVIMARDHYDLVSRIGEDQDPTTDAIVEFVHARPPR